MEVINKTTQFSYHATSALCWTSSRLLLKLLIFLQSVKTFTGSSRTNKSQNSSIFNKRNSGSASQTVYIDTNLYVIRMKEKLSQHLPMRKFQLLSWDMSSYLCDTRHDSIVLCAVGFSRQYNRDANLHFWHTNPLNRNRLSGPRLPSQKKECWWGGKDK